MRIKFIPSLAFSIAHQRSTTDKAIKPPGKNWPQGFIKRHPALKPKRLRAMDWKRHDNNIYNKVINWFEVIENVVKDPTIQLDPRSRGIISKRWCDPILTRWCDGTPGNYICRAVGIGRRNITLVLTSELQLILSENVYNMDETGVMLCMLS